MADTIYADRLLSLNIAKGLVRMEFGTVDSVVEGGQTKQRAVVTQRVVMPLEGFTESFRAQQRALRELTKRLKESAEAGQQPKA